jgi:hypothetical protein
MMHRWQEYSRDPNAPDVIQRRGQALRQAQAGKLVFDRAGYLCGLAAGKSVPDIGVVEHTREASESSHWLHRHLCGSASRCLGIAVGGRDP